MEKSMNTIYINLPTPVISILATPGIAETISSTGSDPPSPSSVMKFKMIATKPNAIGSSAISWILAPSGIES